MRNNIPWLLVTNKRLSFSIFPLHFSYISNKSILYYPLNDRFLLPTWRETYMEIWTMFLNVACLAVVWSLIGWTDKNFLSQLKPIKRTAVSTLWYTCTSSMGVVCCLSMAVKAVSSTHSKGYHTTYLYCEVDKLNPCLIVSIHNWQIIYHFNSMKYFCCCTFLCILTHRDRETRI